MFVAFFVDAIVWYKASSIRFHEEEDELDISASDLNTTTLNTAVTSPAVEEVVSSKAVAIEAPIAAGESSV